MHAYFNTLADKNATPKKGTPPLVKSYLSDNPFEHIYDPSDEETVMEEKGPNNFLSPAPPVRDEKRIRALKRQEEDAARKEAKKRSEITEGGQCAPGLTTNKTVTSPSSPTSSTPTHDSPSAGASKQVKSCGHGIFEMGCEMGICSFSKPPAPPEGPPPALLPEIFADVVLGPGPNVEANAHTHSPPLSRPRRCVELGDEEVLASDPFGVGEAGFVLFPLDSHPLLFDTKERDQTITLDIAICDVLLPFDSIPTATADTTAGSLPQPMPIPQGTAPVTTTMDTAFKSTTNKLQLAQQRKKNENKKKRERQRKLGKGKVLGTKHLLSPSSPQENSSPSKKQAVTHNHKHN